MAVSRGRALVLAEVVLDQEVRPRVPFAVVVLPAATEESDTHWAVFYTSARYLETGRLSDAMVGNGPVIVSKATGEARLVSPAGPWQELAG